MYLEPYHRLIIHRSSDLHTAHFSQYRLKQHTAPSAKTAFPNVRRAKETAETYGSGPIL